MQTWVIVISKVSIKLRNTWTGHSSPRTLIVNPSYNVLWVENTHFPHILALKEFGDPGKFLGLKHKVHRNVTIASEKKASERSQPLLQNEGTGEKTSVLRMLTWARHWLWAPWSEIFSIQNSKKNMTYILICLFIIRWLIDFICVGCTSVCYMSSVFLNHSLHYYIFWNPHTSFWNWFPCEFWDRASHWAWNV